MHRRKIDGVYVVRAVAGLSGAGNVLETGDRVEAVDLAVGKNVATPETHEERRGSILFGGDDGTVRILDTVDHDLQVDRYAN